MEQLQIADQIVLYDRELTRNAYSKIGHGDAERCGCSYCRNFSKQRSTVYPSDFLSLTDRLGIDPAKEDEVFECGPSGELRFYGGWFFFAGQFVEPGEAVVRGLASGFEYWIADGRSRPAPDAEFGADILTLEFFTKLPWLLDDVEP